MARERNLIDGAFVITILVKGVGGLTELASGILLLFISAHTLQHALAPLNRLGITPTITSGTRLFLIIYFCLRGAIRFILALCLLGERLWAYPVTILLLGASVIYQGWLLCHGHPSLGLGGLTLFDAVTLALTAREYLHLRRGNHLHLPLGRR